MSIRKIMYMKHEAARDMQILYGCKYRGVSLIEIIVTARCTRANAIFSSEKNNNPQLYEYCNN